MASSFSCSSLLHTASYYLPLLTSFSPRALPSDIDISSLPAQTKDKIHKLNFISGVQWIMLIASISALAYCVFHRQKIKAIISSIFCYGSYNGMKELDNGSILVADVAARASLHESANAHASNNKKLNELLEKTIGIVNQLGSENDAFKKELQDLNDVKVALGNGSKSVTEAIQDIKKAISELNQATSKNLASSLEMEENIKQLNIVKQGLERVEQTMTAHSQKDEKIAQLEAKIADLMKKLSDGSGGETEKK